MDANTPEIITTSVAFIRSDHWIFPLIQVCLLFFGYVLVIVYMSLYDATNVPNFRTIANFLFDSQSMVDVTMFNEHLKTHTVTTESFVSGAIPEKTSESWQPIKYMQNWGDAIVKCAKSAFVKIHVDGKTVRITHK